MSASTSQGSTVPNFTAPRVQYDSVIYIYSVSILNVIQQDHYQILREIDYISTIIENQYLKSFHLNKFQNNHRSEQQLLRNINIVLNFMCSHDKLDPRCSLLFGDFKSPKLSARSDILIFSQWCPKFIHTYKTQGSWARKQVHLHGTSSLLRILNAPPQICQEKYINKNPKRKFFANAPHATSSRPGDLGLTA